MHISFLLSLPFFYMYLHIGPSYLYLFGFYLYFKHTYWHSCMHPYIHTSIQTFGHSCILTCIHAYVHTNTRKNFGSSILHTHTHTTFIIFIPQATSNMLRFHNWSLLVCWRQTVIFFFGPKRNGSNKTTQLLVTPHPCHSILQLHIYGARILSFWSSSVMRLVSLWSGCVGGSRSCAGIICVHSYWNFIQNHSFHLMLFFSDASFSILFTVFTSFLATCTSYHAPVFHFHPPVGSTFANGT